MLGIRTNIPFLLRLIDLPDFVEGRLHTGFVDEHMASLTGCTEPDGYVYAAAALAAGARRRSSRYLGAAFDAGPVVTADRLGTLTGCPRAASRSESAKGIRQSTSSTPPTGPWYASKAKPST